MAFEQIASAEVVQEIDTAVAAARAGRSVIALDGCRSACCSRVLDAKGVRPQAALNLTAIREAIEPADSSQDPARLALEAVVRLGSHGTTGAQHHLPRPGRPAPTSRAKRAHTTDDYLLAIDALASTAADCGALAAEAPTLASHVSVLLGVSRASAGEMLGRLEAEGLVERGARKEVLLTPSGRIAADRAVTRHRLLERLASDFLGYPPAECYERARLLDDAFDDDGIERARIALGHPERCPHGWPVDPRRARDESRALTALAAFGEGEATVVRLAEHDGPLLTGLFELGLVPGAPVSVSGAERRSTGVCVNVAGSVRRLDPAAASLVFVRERAGI